jgi:hypothetical protein
MAIALVAHQIAHAVDNAQTTAIDTSGANFLIAAVAAFTSGPADSFGDTKSNTWHALGPYTNSAGSMRVRLYYAYNATVGSGHQFTQSTTGSYTTISVAAFSGVQTSGDPYNSDVTGVNDFQTSVGGDMTAGSLTVASGDLLISGEGTPFGQSPSLTWTAAAMTITDQFHTTAVTEGGGLAYAIGSGSSVAASWTPGSGSATGAALVATFKAAAGGGGSTSRNLFFRRRR